MKIMRNYVISYKVIKYKMELDKFIQEEYIIESVCLDRYVTHF